MWKKCISNRNVSTWASSSTLTKVEVLLGLQHRSFHSDANAHRISKHSQGRKRGKRYGKNTSKSNSDEAPLFIDLGNNIKVNFLSSSDESPKNVDNGGETDETKVMSSTETENINKQINDADLLKVEGSTYLLDTMSLFQSLKKVEEYAQEMREKGKKEVNQVDIAELQNLFSSLTTDALPFLAQFVSKVNTSSDPAHGNAVTLTTEALHNLLETPEGNKALSNLTQSLRTVEMTLGSMHALTLVTGRRYEKAFPALLTSALWEKTAPFLHQIHADIRHRARRTKNSKKGKKNEEELSDETAVGNALVSTTSDIEKLQDSFVEEFKRYRRALALRTRQLADVLAPESVIQCLAYMQLCGALSDDILGPMAATLLSTEKEKQHHESRKPSHHSLLSHMVATIPSSTLSLPPDAAVALLRVLGRQSAPGHFHLHQLVHTVLLPSMQSQLSQASQNGAAANISEAALVDLTRCFVRYEVAGDYVDSLTQLWQPYLRRLGTAECASLLRLLVMPPAWAAEDPRRARPKGSRSLNFLFGRSPRRGTSSAQEEYLPLIDTVCSSVVERGAELLTRLQQSQRTGDGGEEVENSEERSEMPPPRTMNLQAELDSWCDLMRVLLKVDNPNWPQVYLTAADCIYYLIQVRMDEILLAIPEREDDALLSIKKRNAKVKGLVKKMWEATFPLETTEQLVRNLLHRNTLIPDHPLHGMLVKRLLYAKESLSDPKLSNLALLGMEMMMAPPLSSQEAPKLNNNDVSNGERKERGGKNSSLTLVENKKEAIAQRLQPYFEPRITSEDVQRAFSLFQRHTKELSFNAYVSAMHCLPLERLPLPEQQEVVTHLTSIASSLHPQSLVKGISAAVQLQVKLNEKNASTTTTKSNNSAAIVDPLSVRKWLSRFNLHAVLNKMDIDSCTNLLQVYSLDPNYSVNSAIAKQNILSRVGFLLNRWEGETVPLESLKPLMASLRAADAFYPQLFSRICRLLLSQVKDAPLSALLPAFAMAADEFTRRPNGTLFKDVWELLRARLIARDSDTEEVTRKDELMSLEEVATAINGFAFLDLNDRPLFLVLVHRLWELMKKEAAMQHDPQETAATTAYEYEVTPEKDPTELEETKALQKKQLQSLAAHVTSRLLSPSGVAVLTATLLYWRDADALATLLPPTLVALYAQCHALYPIDVVLLLPQLLRGLNDVQTQLDALNQPQKSGKDKLLKWIPENSKESEHLILLLHRAYDGCRTFFLFLYQDPAAYSKKAVVHVGDETKSEQEKSKQVVIEKQMAAIAELPEGLTNVEDLYNYGLAWRSMWTGKIKASILVVPKRHFASIVLEVSNCGMRDEELVCAAMDRFISGGAKTLKSDLHIQELVDLFLSLCFHFVAPPNTNTTATANSADGDANKYKMYLAPVLTSLWERTDELSIQQVDAIVRGLRYYFSQDKLDEDFVQRLTDQKNLLLDTNKKIKDAQEEVKEKVISSSNTAPLTSDAPQDAEEVQGSQQEERKRETIEISADDLFEL